MNSETNTHIAAIRRWRKAAGLTIAQFAERCGVATTTAWAWENGKQSPSPKYYPVIASVLRIPPEEVVDLFAHVGQVDPAAA